MLKPCITSVCRLCQYPERPSWALPLYRKSGYRPLVRTICYRLYNNGVVENGARHCVTIGLSEPEQDELEQHEGDTAYKFRKVCLQETCLKSTLNVLQQPTPPISGYSHSPLWLDELCTAIWRLRRKTDPGRVQWVGLPGLGSKLSTYQPVYWSSKLHNASYRKQLIEVGTLLPIWPCPNHPRRITCIQIKGKCEKSGRVGQALLEMQNQ